MEEQILEFLNKLSINNDSVTFEPEEGLLKISLLVPEDRKGLLIGRRGETLESIQLLISLMINNNKDRSQATRILLDIAGYREERLAKILEKAEEIAAYVEKTGSPRSLPNLSSTERRQVHTHFALSGKFTTYSQGEGDDRRLFISLSSPK